ncbi:MAG: carbon-nitrogen hydrolase family protein [bacterium]|nr:carbon-nitrogen hydrolase family protein [bacterium]
MSKFKIALLQIRPGRNLSENLCKGLKYCAKAKELGADLVLFPEMWSNGYQFPGKGLTRKEWEKDAINKKSEFFSKFRIFAKENKIAVGLTYLERYKSGKFRNTVSVIDRFGKCILTYAKVHTCAFSDEKILTPGTGFFTADLDTGKEIIKLGAMICYDREFPETARILMLKGAEIILIPNACEMEINRTSQLRARAFENMVGIALANYPGERDKGRSMAFDGIAFSGGNKSKDGISRDMKIIEGIYKESILIAEFDMKKLRTYQQNENWGKKFRHPEKYKVISKKRDS